MSLPNRNDPCPCGSSKKYKHCCLKRNEGFVISRCNEKASIEMAMQEAITHHQAGRLAQAETIYQQMLEINPRHADALHLLGVLAHQTGRHEVAANLIGKAIKLNPTNATYFNNLGSVLLAQDKLEEAAESYRHASTLKPDYAEAHYNLGNVLQAQGSIDTAIEYYDKAISLKPDYVEAYVNLGTVLQNLGKFDAAMANFLLALSINPNHAEAHYNLGNALQEQDQLDAAIASFLLALSIKPDYAETHYNLGIALQARGQQDAAAASFRRALEIKPDFEGAYSNLLFVLNYHPDLGAEEIYRAYQEYEERKGQPLRSTWRAHNNNRNPARRLRLGYVSPDFRLHSTRLFLEPLLAHHDKRQVEVYAYAELSAEDAMTARYRGYVDHWIPTKGLGDEALAERIRSDGIDILVDLAGHTVGNRLLVFARKPAPVSVSWLGYGYTTGLKAIDYFLSDATCVPSGSEALFSEQPWRIATPAYVYRPAEGMGEVSPLPALERGYITFGTLTRSVRINHRVVRVWAEILKAVPNATLVIDSSNFKEAAMQERLAAQFAEHGIARERLLIGCHSPPWDVLRGIDIGLDCFPHNSGTTLFETLYMGVPYVTLAGRPSVGRLGACVLHGVGHPEWIAESEQEYIEKAVELANHPERLAAIRASLRQEMENSPLMDEAGFARKVENAYRNMWQIWCETGKSGTAQGADTETLAIDQALQQAIELHQAGRLDEAENIYRQILRIDPHHSDALHLLGVLAHQTGRHEVAAELIGKAIKLNPADAAYFNNLGSVLLAQDKLEEAAESYRHASTLKPDYAEAHYNLGNVLHIQGESDTAIESFRQALLLKPDYVDALYNWGNILQIQGDFAAAIEHFSRVLMLRPDWAEAHYNLGNALQIQGELDDAISHYCKACSIKPDYVDAHGNLLFALDYHPDLAAEEIYGAYQEYEEQKGRPLRSTWRPHHNDRNPARRLRLGYVSPDFRLHSTRLFLEPLLAHHDKHQVEVYAYAELSIEDAMTARYQGYADHWIPTKGLGDEALAERIRSDGIDILVDLAGHTAGNRLLVFARKPAPVSVSWLGYGYTTGLKAIDYFLSDATCVPPGSEALFSEQPWRIPTPSYVYRPASGMGEVSPLPALERGYITFGTLTRSVRINHRVVRVWAEILKAVPNARLVIDSSNFKEAAMQERLAAQFAEHGIERERLLIGCHSPPWDVLRGIDIGLDCFPHNSGTTLFETLYMGVPYVTLAGRPSVGRLGACVLQGVGHPEWIAQSEEEYIEKAVELANNPERLAHIRATLRQEMENGPLMDEAGFARKVENAYRNMWENWCETGKSGTAQGADTETLAIDQALQQAIELHQAGREQEAEQLYCAILQVQQNHPVANHNLGMLMGQKGQHADALSYLKTALEAEPSCGQYWESYAEALLASGQALEAQMVIQTAMQCGLDTAAIQELMQKAEAVVQGALTANIPETEASKAKEQTKGASEPAKNTAKKKAKHPQARNQGSKNAALPSSLESQEILALFNSARYADVEERVRRLLESSPHWAWGWKVLGTAMEKQGKDGVEALQHAVELAPDDAEAHNNLGFLLQTQGRFDSAQESLRRALKIRPDYADAHNNLGIVLHGLRRFDAAEESYRRALQINPGLAEAHNNLGNTLKELGRLDDAAACFSRAIEIVPTFAKAHNNLGNALNELGRASEADTSLRHALSLKPDYAEAYYNLGIALMEQGRLIEAQESYRRALEIKPDFAEAHNNLGAALKDDGKLDAAIASCGRALELKPNSAEAHNNRGSILKDMGEFNTAQNSFRRALEINPDYADAHGNLLFALNYHPDLAAEEIYGAYQEYEEQKGQPLRSTWRSHNNDRNPARRLRLGYVSPDFRWHSTRLFLEPLLAHHDKHQVEVYAYAELAVEDTATARYRGYVDHWIPTKGLSDEALAERIRSDGIDILVDLAGHTAGNRLLVFARKPAPVSVSWLGYGYTTGLKAIDYFLSDATCVPPGSEALFSEQPWRIATPSYVYRPASGMGEVSSLPALERGYITFGTLTRSVRINHRVVRVWAEILKAVPNATLVIDSSNFKEAAMQERLAAQFAEHGIERERLLIGCHSPPWDVLRGIDIGLDCFPHNSGTTLFETLYMGVPYVTLAGRPSVGRLGACVLHGVGHPEWIAESEQEYIEKAVELANRPERLAAIRASLRQEMGNGPLMDEAGFARKVENAYRNMWEKWCMGSN